VQERVLRDAKVDKGSIDDIVLVGGSTRIPRIQKLLQVRARGGRGGAGLPGAGKGERPHLRAGSLRAGSPMERVIIINTSHPLPFPQGKISKYLPPPPFPKKR
jgi:heat shock protein 5